MAMFSGKIVLCDAYCSALPIATSFRPPRFSRAEEALRPCAPLRPVKREVQESEADSAEFIVEEEDEQPIKVERPIKVEQDPRQICFGIAAISIRQPASAASSSSEEAPGPSGTAYRRPCAKFHPASWAQQTRHVAEAGLKGQKVGRGLRFHSGCQLRQSGQQALRLERASPR